MALDVDALWHSTVADLQTKFFKSYRDAKTIQYAATVNYVEITGFKQLDLIRLSDWCEKHLIHFVVNTTNHNNRNRILLTLYRDPVVNSDLFFANRFELPMGDNNDLSKSVKERFPTDNNRIVQMLMPFIHTDTFKCTAKPEYEIAPYGSTIGIVLRECTINKTTIDHWCRHNEPTVRITAYCGRVSISMMPIATRKFVEKFKPY